MKFRGFNFQKALRIVRPDLAERYLADTPKPDHVVEVKPKRVRRNGVRR